MNITRSESIVGSTRLRLLMNLYVMMNLREFVSALREVTL